MRKQTQNYLAILLLILLGGLVLGRSLNNEFLNWDDPSQVLNNPLIRRVSLRQVGVIFSTPVAVGGLRQYHPLVTLINALEYRFFGLDPFPYHLHNLLFFSLSFLSKSAAVTFPLVLVAYDYWRGRKLKVGLIAEKTPFFLLLVLGVVMTLRDQLAVTPGVKLHSEVACGNVLLAARSVLFYLGRALFPLNLSPFYPWPCVLSICR